MFEGQVSAVIRRKRSGRRARLGFSMVEILTAFTILVVSAGAVAMSFVRALDVQRSNEETQRALDAAESVIESMKAADYAQVFALFNADAADDPVGGAPGPGFTVVGLEPVPGDADGLPGEIAFPTNGLELREDAVDPFLGMPRDLNGDSAVDAANHAADYQLLPVVVRVRWTGVSGNREIRLVTTLRNL